MCAHIEKFLASDWSRAFVFWLVVGLPLVTETAGHGDSGLKRKSCDQKWRHRNRKSRDLEGKTAEPSGKGIAGSGWGKNRWPVGKNGSRAQDRWGTRAQSPKSNWGIGGGPWLKEKTPCWKNNFLLDPWTERQATSRVPFVSVPCPDPTNKRTCEEEVVVWVFLLMSVPIPWWVQEEKQAYIEDYYDHKGIQFMWMMSSIWYECSY